MFFPQDPAFFSHATLSGLLYEILVALLKFRVIPHVRFTLIVIQRVVRLRIVGVDPLGRAACIEQ